MSHIRLAILLMLLLATQAMAQPLLLPRASHHFLDTAIDLRSYAQLWIPDAEDISQKPWTHTATFHSPSDWKALFDGLDRPHVMWIKVELDAQHHSPEQPWLISWNAYESTLFYHEAGKWDSIHSGNFVPVSARPFGSTYGAIAFLPVPIQAGERQTFYFRILPGQVKIHERLEWAHAKLMTPVHFINYDQRSRSFDLLILGLILAIALYHLIIFQSTKRREYLYFSLFGLALVIFLLNLKDYTLVGFWPSWPRWNYTGFTMMVGFLVFFTFVRFTRHFLQLPRYAPRRSQAIDALLLINFLFILFRMGMEVVAPEIHARYHPPLAQAMRINWVLVAVLTFWAAIRSFQHLPIITRRYLLTNSLLILITLLRLLSTSGVIPYRLPFDGIALAVVVQQIFFALTLAAHINQINQDKQTMEAQVQAEKAQAEKLAALDEAKSRLFTDLTHEFRTPLTIISGLSDELRRNAKVRREERLSLIQRNSEQLNRLISQILDLAKLDAQQISLNLEQGDVVPLLRFGTEIFHTLAEDQGLRLQFYSDQDQVVMDHDPQRLQQILNNLVSNAIKYTPQDGKVSVVLTQPDPEQLIITVADTGVGIPPAQLPHVFDRFYQAGQDTPRPAQGTGIGLALVKDLVSLMGGEISVDSTEGEGSRFRVQLPITRQATLASDQPPQQPDHVAPVAEEMGLDWESAPDADQRPQLLIVEDNPDVRYYLRSCLADAYQILEAANGQEGLDIAQSQLPDLIVSDMMMPRLNGLELLTALREDTRTDHIPLLMLTARVEDKARLDSFRLGADGYLSKPFQREELRVRVANLLESRARWRSNLKEHAATDAPEVPTDPRAAFVQQLDAIIQANIGEESFGTERLGRELGLSRTQLHRKVKSITGIPPATYVRRMRMEEARHQLLHSDLNINEVAFQVGYADPAHFTRVYHQHFGEPPSNTRQG